VLVSADGSVPTACRLSDGNTFDDPTHVPTWDALVKALGKANFRYFADSKLCSGEAMRHIDRHGGRFVIVLPRTLGEDKWFRGWIQSSQPHGPRRSGRLQDGQGEGPPAATAATRRTRRCPPAGPCASQGPGKVIKSQ
jgi:hypothetical protein